MPEKPMMGYLQKTSFWVVVTVKKGPGTGTSPCTLRWQVTHHTELEAILKHLAFLLILPNGSLLGPNQRWELCYLSR